MDRDNILAIESLCLGDNPEALAVLRQAFQSHPILPPGTPPQTAEGLLKLILETFGESGKAWFHGIRKDGVLACVALSLEANYEPQGLVLLRFFCRLFSVLGWSLTWEFIKAFSKRMKYRDAYLELMLMGTLPVFQGQGLGKAMLRSCPRVVRTAVDRRVGQGNE